MPSLNLPDNLAANLIRFGELLRKEGVEVTLSGLLSAAEGLRHISILRKDDFKTLLMATLLNRREEIEIFDRLFESFWTATEQTALPSASVKEDQEAAGQDETGEVVDYPFEQVGDGAPDSPSEREEYLGWSLEEIDAEVDFGNLTEEQVEPVKRAIMRWSRLLTTRISRRYRRSSRSLSRMDFRRTFRRAMKYAGVTLELVYKAKKPKRNQIVLLCDVSGSMDIYSRFFILFMYGLHRALRRSEIFVFSTRLTRISPFLKAWSLEKALSRLKGQTLNWSGGTNIGNSLYAFYTKYGQQLLHKRTILIIVSDGWDRGDPELLEETLQKVKRRAKKILWLNPLLASPDYRPVCTGMRTALPFVDRLLPLYNLQSLIRLGRILERSIAGEVAF